MGGLKKGKSGGKGKGKGPKGDGRKEPKRAPHQVTSSLPIPNPDWCIQMQASHQQNHSTATYFLSIGVQDDTQRDALLPLQERVAAVKPFWETMSQEERVKTLTVSIKELRTRAADVAERQRKQAGLSPHLSVQIYQVLSSVLLRNGLF